MRITQRCIRYRYITDVNRTPFIGQMGNYKYVKNYPSRQLVLIGVVDKNSNYEAKASGSRHTLLRSFPFRGIHCSDIFPFLLISVK